MKLEGEAKDETDCSPRKWSELVDHIRKVFTACWLTAGNWVVAGVGMGTLAMPNAKAAWTA